MINAKKLSACIISLAARVSNYVVISNDFKCVIEKNKNKITNKFYEKL